MKEDFAANSTEEDKKSQRSG